MTEPCQQETTIKTMDKKLDKMDSKLDLLLSEYWQAKGRKSFILSALAFLISIVGVFVKR